MADPLYLDLDQLQLDADTLFLSDDAPAVYKVSVRPKRRIISSGRPMNLSGDDDYDTDKDSTR